MPTKPRDSRTDEALKSEVRNYWEAGPCNTEVAEAPRFSRDYWEQIEATRYEREPEIHAFAQFSRAHGKRVLEVGVGAGTDFLQWVRSGARAHGVDLTEAGVEHVERRLETYGLEAEEVRVADAERLPFDDASFDLCYSWGVIHHSPNTRDALAEIVRVCRPGGQVKVMVYHRYSALSLWLWVRHALLAGKPWRSIDWAVANNMESAGTKVYSVSEVHALCAELGLVDVRVACPPCYHDRVGRGPRMLLAVLSRLRRLDRIGWFLMIDARKPPVAR